MFTYKAKVMRVIDGDTLEVALDLGFNISFTEKLRLFNINAPELKTEEGVKARDFLLYLLGDGNITVNTIKDRKGKYGRYLAILFKDNVNINLEMVNEGHAK